MTNVEIGDIVLFPQGGIKSFVSYCLAWLLWLLVDIETKRKWARKHWHLGVVSNRSLTGLNIFEATAIGACQNFYSWDKLKGFKIWHLPKATTMDDMGRFITDYNGKPYDVDNYFSVFWGSIRRFVFHKPYRVIDDENMCWELARAWLDRNEASPVKDSVPLLITDLAKEADGV